MHHAEISLCMLHDEAYIERSLHLVPGKTCPVQARGTTLNACVITFRGDKAFQNLDSSGTQVTMTQFHGGLQFWQLPSLSEHSILLSAHVYDVSAACASHLRKIIINLSHPSPQLREAPLRN